MISGSTRAWKGRDTSALIPRPESGTFRPSRVGGE